MTPIVTTPPRPRARRPRRVRLALAVAPRAVRAWRVDPSGIVEVLPQPGGVR